MDVAVASLSNPQIRNANRQRSPLEHLNEHGNPNSLPLDGDLDNADWTVPHNSDIKTENSPASSPGVSESGLPVDCGGSSSRGSSMSGDGGGDTASHASSVDTSTVSTSNRRKRKSVPVKRPSSNDPEEDESELNEEVTNKKQMQDAGMNKKLYQMRWNEVENETDSKDNTPATAVPVSVSISAIEKPSPVPTNLNGQKDFATMDEARMRMQLINAQPRKFCPVCGDKANGLHYGIYSCEGCKNFFKRSVLVCQDRPYVCKFGNTCSVSITEVYGVKQKTSRCQACRYQACIDAGMYHSGVQRSRGGRHSYSPAKLTQRGSSASNTKSTQNSVSSRTNSSSPPSASALEPLSSNQSKEIDTSGVTSKYPQIQTPDIAAHLAAVASSNTSSLAISDFANSNNGHSESHSKNSQIFSKHLQLISQRSANANEDSISQDRLSRGKHKTNNNGNSNHQAAARDFSIEAKDGASSKEALDFKRFAENLIRKNMSSVSQNAEHEDRKELDTSNITLKSLLSNVNSQEVRFMERFQAENLNSEIEILKAKNRELQLSSAEKDKQLQLYQKQADTLKNALSKADKINKEQARTIESLKQSLLKEMERHDEAELKSSSSFPHSNIGLTMQKKGYSNYMSDYDQNRLKDSNKVSYKQDRHSKSSEEDIRDSNFAIYERGGVTITPVNCSGSKNSNGSYNFKGEPDFESKDDRYEDELATIEPVIEMNCSDEEAVSSADGEERILRGQSPIENMKIEHSKELPHGNGH